MSRPTTPGNASIQKKAALTILGGDPATQFKKPTIFELRNDSGFKKPTIFDIRGNDQGSCIPEFRQDSKPKDTSSDNDFDRPDDLEDPEFNPGDSDDDDISSIAYNPMEEQSSKQLSSQNLSSENHPKKITFSNQASNIPVSHAKNGNSSQIPRSVKPLNSEKQNIQKPKPKPKPKEISPPSRPYLDDSASLNLKGQVHSARSVESEESAKSNESKKETHYKPYSIEDYREIQQMEAGINKGSLGPSYDDEWEHKNENRIKLMQFAEKQRKENLSSLPKKTKPHNPPPKQPSKRDKMKEYAANLPRPKTKSRASSETPRRVKPIKAEYDIQAELQRHYHFVERVKALEIQCSMYL